MWKIAIGFVIFAAIALFAIFKGGDKVDMSGEKHDTGSHAPAASGAGHGAAPAAPAPASAPAPAASAASAPAAAPAASAAASAPKS